MMNYNKEMNDGAYGYETSQMAIMPQNTVPLFISMPETAYVEIQPTDLVYDHGIYNMHNMHNIEGSVITQEQLGANEPTNMYIPSILEMAGSKEEYEYLSSALHSY